MNNVARIICNDYSRVLNGIKLSVNIAKSGKHISDDKKFKKYARKSLDCLRKKIDLAAEKNELMYETSLSDNIVAGFLEGFIGTAGALAVFGAIVKVSAAVRGA